MFEYNARGNDCDNNYFPFNLSLIEKSDCTLHTCGTHVLYLEYLYFYAFTFFNHQRCLVFLKSLWYRFQIYFSYTNIDMFSTLLNVPCMPWLLDNVLVSVQAPEQTAYFSYHVFEERDKMKYV